jgi:hypothetical protein
MSAQIEPQSRRIQSAITKAAAEREALAVLLADLHTEQRKLSALATIDALDDAQAARLAAVASEIAEKQARHAEIGNAIAGAREMLDQALKEERAAVADADWARAEGKLGEAQAAARELDEILQRAGHQYGKVQLLLQEAFGVVVPHVRESALMHLQPPHGLHSVVGQSLKASGGPDFGCGRWNPDYRQPEPSLEWVVSDHTRRFMNRRITG